MDIAQRHGLFVVEDAAQGMMSTYKERPLGTIGHMAAYSFHETKNFTSGGEGGLLIINDERFVERAEIIREKGTNRSQFFRGMVDKYSWVDVGSSYLPCELQAAYLWGQLEKAQEINNNRMNTWLAYYQALKPLEQSGLVKLPYIPANCEHNAHMFYLKTKDLEERTRLLEHFKLNDILAVFHYVPLHSASAGKVFSRFHGNDNFTTVESERLVRLPIWYGMELTVRLKIIDAVVEFFS
jgi:dTDP-4-amino-4,6-dideoxygalactose transaminase